MEGHALMNLVFDIDGVIANFESGWNPVLAKIAGSDKLPAGWQDDPGFPDIWDWDKRAYGLDVVREGWKHVATSATFWKTLKPMKGGVEACKRLNTLQKTHDIFFMTSRPGLAVQRQTCEWLYEQGVNYPNVIVVKHFDDKIPLLENLQARLFIDDKLDTMELWYNHCYTAGIKTVNPNYFALIDAPYNRDNRTVKGMRVVSDINTALLEAGF